jgi:sulfite reductase alpha subunit-like flavoprotein
MTRSYYLLFFFLFVMHLTVLFGSQLGTAEDVAESIAREAKRRHWAVDVFSMDDFLVNLKASGLSVMMISHNTLGYC